MINSSAWRVCLSLSIFLLSAAGCTSFQGPGDFKGPAYSASKDDLPPIDIPAVTLNGERHTVIEEQEISFDWPVDEARLTQGFKLGKRRPHWGIDLASRRGTHILAAEKGTVIYAGRAFKGYGNLVVVEHNSEWATLYSHLDKITAKEGQQIKRGDKIGLMGRTGRATGVHLHFEIRQNRQPVNPLAFLPKGMVTADRIDLNRALPFRFANTSEH